MPTATSTSVSTWPLLCVAGVPAQIGVNTTDCVGRFGGDVCTISCSAGFVGDQKLYRCADGLIKPDADPITCIRASCSRGLPSGPYNTTACHGRVSGEFCTVRCDDGYEDSSHVFMCNSSGVFEGKVDICQRRACGAWTLPSRRDVESSNCAGARAGDDCSVSCAVGFVGEPTTFTCGNNGRFNGMPPQCSAVTCGMPYNWSHAGMNHTCAGVEHGESCSSHCLPGYIGRVLDYVCHSGTLQGSPPPSCEPAECTMGIPTGLGMQSTCVGTRTGEPCEAWCMDGYEVSSGSGNCTCEDTGRIDGCDLRCVKSTCPPLSALGAAWRSDSLDIASCDGKQQNETCGVACAPGYAPVGETLQMLTCDATRSDFYLHAATRLAARPPGCRGMPCSGFAMPIRRGMNTSDCEGKTTGETCVVTAQPGYTATGGGTLICRPHGLFAGALPDISPEQCEVEPPMTGTGVETTCGNTTVNQDCWTYCQAGYEGNFTQLVCEHDPAARDVHFLAVGFTNDAMSLGSCAPVRSGRRLQAGHCDDNYTDLSASWEAGMTSDCRGKASGGACLVFCSTGYEIIGDPVMYTCTEAGTFSGSGVPTCRPKECVAGFPSGVGVMHSCIGTLTDATCTASCKQGYSGPATNFTCQASGDLSGTSPTCTANECSPLSLPPQYDNSSCSGATTGSACLVECATGYSGDATQYTCLSNGSFAGSVPSCSANSCGSMGVPVGSDLVTTGCDGLSTGQTCAVRCAEGYVGAAELWTCTGQGSLDGRTPSCAPEVCPDLVAGAGIEDTCSDVAYGRSCVAGCAANYQLAAGETSQELRCGWNASSGSVGLLGVQPSCEPTPCPYGLPAGGPFNTSACAGLAHGGECRVACVAGYEGLDYEAVGGNSFSCGASGMAEGTLPTCRPKKCEVEGGATVDARSCGSAEYGSKCFLACAEGYASQYQHRTCNVTAGGTMSLVGAPIVCEARECLFNLPAGPQFDPLFDCSGVRVGESCEVRCGPAFTGAPATLTCGSNLRLEGALPICMPAAATTAGTTAAPTTAFTTAAPTTAGTTPAPTTAGTTAALTTAGATTSVGATVASSMASSTAGAVNPTEPVSETTTAGVVADSTTSGTATLSLTSAAASTTVAATPSATSTLSASSSVTVAASGGGELVDIIGTLLILVDDPYSFVEDPVVVGAVEKSIATIAGVSAALVKVELAVVARRLDQRPAARRLASSVEAKYTISLADASAAEAVVASISEAPAATITSYIAEGIADVYGPGRYSVEVMAVSMPTVRASPGIPAPEDFGSSGPAKASAAAIAGALGAILGCICCCVAGVVISHRRAAKRARKAQAQAEVERAAAIAAGRAMEARVMVRESAPPSRATAPEAELAPEGDAAAAKPSFAPAKQDAAAVVKPTLKRQAAKPSDEPMAANAPSAARTEMQQRGGGHGDAVGGVEPAPEKAKARSRPRRGEEEVEAEPAPEKPKARSRSGSQEGAEPALVKAKARSRSGSREGEVEAEPAPEKAKARSRSRSREVEAEPAPDKAKARSRSGSRQGDAEAEPAPEKANARSPSGSREVESPKASPKANARRRRPSVAKADAELAAKAAGVADEARIEEQPGSAPAAEVEPALEKQREDEAAAAEGMGTGPHWHEPTGPAEVVPEALPEEGHGTAQQEGREEVRSPAAEAHECMVALRPTAEDACGVLGPPACATPLLLQTSSAAPLLLQPSSAAPKALAAGSTGAGQRIRVHL